jgi:hypothetical protein
VKDSQGDPAYGRTSWRRFAIAVAVPTAAAGALVFGMANGAFAASFPIAGQPFKISADKLVGTGFTQYGGQLETAKTGDADVPVAMSGIASADLYNLCQSVRTPHSPISLTIRAGRGATPAKATNLLIGMSELNGDAVFTDMRIGQDASTLGLAGKDAHGAVGGFGQEASDVTITHLKQTAVSTTAGTFTLTGLTLKINFPGDDGNPEECF